MKTHIPDYSGGECGERAGLTYCGRIVSEVECINPRSDCIEDATCKACQRSDDRRVREEYMLSDEYLKEHGLERVPMRNGTRVPSTDP